MPREKTGRKRGRPCSLSNIADMVLSAHTQADQLPQPKKRGRPRKVFSTENQPENKGRRKGDISLNPILKRRLQEEDPDSKKIVAELLVDSWIREAMKGKFPYFKEIVDRVDGKPKDTIDIQGKLLENMKIEVVFVK